MDFELTADQEALQDGMRVVPRRSLLTRYRARRSRRLVTSTATRWHELGETGVFSLALPEADGGLELGISEAALVFEELGRALVPGPLVATFLAAPWVDGAATGEHDRRVLRAGGAGERGRASARPRRVARHRSMTAYAASTRRRSRPSRRPADRSTP